jgi:hypothetical protein
MANRLICNFDDYDLTGLQYEFTSNAPGNISLQSSGRNGYCLRNSNNATYVYNTPIPEGAATVYFGFALRTATVSSAGTVFFQIGDGFRPHLLFFLNTDGTVSAYRSGSSSWPYYSTAGGTSLCTSTGTISNNTWMYFEAKATINNSTGEIAMRFNGSGTDDATGVYSGDTQNSGSALVRSICFGGDTNSAYDFDDFYLNDASGSYCNGFMGNCRVDHHLPVTPDGANTGWTPSTGSDAYAVIDDNPPSTSDYNHTSTTDAIDTLNCDDFKNGTSTIYAIQPTMLVNKSDAGTVAIQSVIRENSTNSASGNNIYLTTSWLYMKESYSLNTGSDAKASSSGFNAAEYGYKKTA